MWTDCITIHILLLLLHRVFILALSRIAVQHVEEKCSGVYYDREDPPLHTPKESESDKSKWSAKILSA